MSQIFENKIPYQKDNKETKDEKQIALEKSWSIINKYFKDESIVKQQLDSFNNFITYGLTKIIKDNGFIKIEGEEYGTYKLFIKEIDISNPFIVDTDRKLKKIYPSDARLKDLYYEGNVTIDIDECIEKDGKIVEYNSYRKISIAKIPIMLNSCKCNLSTLTPEEKIYYKECPNDPGGYFIVKGYERVLIAQTRGLYNNVLVTLQKNIDKNKYCKYIAEMRSMSEETGHSILIKANIDWNEKNITFSIPYIKENIHIGIVFKAFGFFTKQEISTIIGITDEKYLRTIMKESNHINTQEEALTHIGLLSKHMIEKKKIILYATQVLETELFPHLGITSTNIEKIYLLGKMVNKLLLTNNGIRSSDSKDNYSIKRVECSGYLLKDLFRTLFKRFMIEIKQNLEKKKQKPDIVSMIGRTNRITHGIRLAMSTGNWAAQKSTYFRTGVSQVLSRLSYGAFISHLRRMVLPVGKEVKNAEIRQIHTSQVGFICPCETPEGANTGIVLNFTTLTSITTYISVILIKDIILKHLSNKIININNIPFSSIGDYIPVYVNGCILGVTNEPDYVNIYLHKLKYSNRLNRQISIIYNIFDKEICVFCDEGRLIRPVFTVDSSNKLKIDDLKEDDLEKMTWDELVEKDYIRYIDNREQESSVLSMYKHELKTLKSDFCEIHPILLLGTMACNVPFPDMSQSPRNLYASAMGKQALGSYALSHPFRTDTIVYQTNYHQKPLVTSKMSSLIGYNNMPHGMNVMVAVLCHTGFNQEDSIILNKSSVERGLYVTTSYKTISDNDKEKNGVVTTYCIPPINMTDQKNYQRKKANYSLLDFRGLVKKSSKIKNGDVLIGKTSTTRNKNGDITIVDNSVISKFSGIIDNIFFENTHNGYNIVKIKIREERIPEQGDKFACYTDKHEILTTEGWINISLLTLSHKVACLENGNLVYKNPETVQMYPYKGDIYSINNKNIELDVTLNHRMYISYPYHVNPYHPLSFHTNYPTNIKGKKLIYCSGIFDEKYRKNTENYFRLTSTINIKLDAWCIFFCYWFLYGKIEFNGTYYIVIDLSKIDADKKKIFFDCLENFDINYSLLLSIFISNDVNIISLFLEYYPIESNNSRIPKWCFDLDVEYSKLILDFIFEESEILVVKNKYLSDDIQQLSLHAGYFSVINDCKNEYKIILNKNIYTIVNNNVNDDKIIKYDGNVYCCTVPTTEGIIYVRKNGKPVWCGNSREAQKGTTGIVLPAYDLPFNKDGIVPDIIINPHCLPSRMTINQLLETSLGKACVSLGEFGDSTAFEYTGKISSLITNKLRSVGLQQCGFEHLTNGMTGEPIKALVFFGPTYYQRLKHMVKDKEHSRASGNVTSLTRQPLGGRASSGGLRFGEMERDCMIVHGTTAFVKERLFTQSDPFTVVVCDKCGFVTSSINECFSCKTNKVTIINIPYATKLLISELISMGIKPKIMTDNSV